MTGVRNRIGLVVVLLLILIPAVYVLADEAYIDSDRFTVNAAEIDGDIQFADVTGCSVRMQVTNHGDDFEGTLKILRYESTDGSYVSAVGRTVHIKSGETQDIYLKLSNIAYDGTPYYVPVRVDFLDKDGQLLCQKITDFQVSPDITTKVAAGVYTDDAQKLAVIDQSRFKYEITNISGDITMKSRQMTDEELANIKQLNINLLILDKVVSESTWENVSEWIMCGGYAMMEKACCQNMIHKMPDDNGLVIIPGSRGDYSWIVQPVANEKTLHSLAHGAGRKWGRTECKGRLAAKYTATQLSRTELGSRVICRDKQLIFEEAPQAYKSAESVVQCLVQAGLIIPVARLRPVLTLKNSGGKKG